MEAFLKRQKEKQEKERADAKQRQMLKAQQEAEAKKRAEMLRNGVDAGFSLIFQDQDRIRTQLIETKISRNSKINFHSICSVQFRSRNLNKQRRKNQPNNKGCRIKDRQKKRVPKLLPKRNRGFLVLILRESIFHLSFIRRITGYLFSSYFFIKLYSL